MQEITQALVREWLDYDPITGTLTWKARGREWFKTEHHWQSWNTQHAGRVAGTLNSNGYRRLNIAGRLLYAHRVIWLWMTGSWPKALIDHDNRKRDDNRWDNLREVTHQENAKNQSLRSNNRSGVPGVYWDKMRCMWVANIRANGEKTMYLGSFITKDAAESRRKDAEKSFGFSPQFGREAA